MKTRSLLALILAAGMAASVVVAEPPATTTQPDGHKHGPNDSHKHAPKADKPAGEKSRGVKVGDVAPTFSIADTEGKTVNLADFKGKTVVLFWYNSECPGIKQHYTKDSMTFNKLHEEYNSKGVQLLAVCSSAPDKQGGGKELNVKAKTDWKIQHPVLLDESGATGRAYGATNTPQVFIVDKDGKIAYKGAIDNGSMGKVGDKNYAKLALDNILAGKAADPAETKAYGCSVKYAK